MKVVVLAGGISAEKDISIMSGECVAEALRSSGHEVEVHDPAIGLDSLLSTLKLAEVVFPALHGIGGEDGSVQQFLEDNGIAFVGSDSESSTRCFDKYSFGRLLAKNGFNVPATELVNLDAYLESELSEKPHVLKPYDGGSSIDTFIIRDLNEIPEVEIESAFSRHGDMLLQELIEGVEITVPILDDTALPVVEIITPEGKEFDYENKYNGATEEACPPRNVSEDLQKQAQKITEKIHRLAGCRDLSRTDLIITHDGKPYILETNTMPGMTNQSIVPKAAEVAGMDMPALCDHLVQAADSRRKSQGTVSAS